MTHSSDYRIISWTSAVFSSGILLIFTLFFVDFKCEITEEGLNWTKKVENGWKKVVRPAFGCDPKANQNTQQTMNDSLNILKLNFKS